MKRQPDDSLRLVVPKPTQPAAAAKKGTGAKGAEAPP